VLIDLLRKVFGRTRTPGEGVEAVVSDALALESAGRRDAAREALRATLGRGASPSNTLLRTLARLEAQGGDPNRAVALLTQAVASAPDSADTLGDLGNAYLVLGVDREAEAAYVRALTVDPDHVRSLNNLGLVRARRGEREAALECFRGAFRRDPEFAPALENLVAWLPDDAVPATDIALLEQTIARMPNHVAAHAALGALHLRGAFAAEPALAALDRAIALGADDVRVHTSHGVALHELGRHGEALSAYERALALDPKNVRARFHRAIALLALGRYAEGWTDYELRLISEDRAQRTFAFPAWRGEDLAGRSILVHAEQGLGDEILFAGCLPDIMQRAARTIVDCDPRLESLYRRSFPGAEIHGESQLAPTDWAARLEVDFQSPIGSLPRFLRRTSAEFPSAGAGYLRADPDRVAAWRARLAGAGAGPWIGVSWRGGTLRSRGPARSLAPELLAPLLATGGLNWASLQRGASEAELTTLHLGSAPPVAGWPDALEDLEETAALLGALDLVITVDNTIAQLAGATGRPVWVLLPFAPEWRYGTAHDRTPWYPTARLFRQASPGAWKRVIDPVARELCTWAAARR
jgi:tetratricopeptide (TPR) repeat protein